MKLLDAYNAARRASTPLVAIDTPDPAATITALVVATRNRATLAQGDVVIVEWNVVDGMRPRSKSAETWIASVAEQDPTVLNPLEAIAGARRLPAGGLFLVHLAHRFLEQPAFVQCIWNVRDEFKEDGRTLVLLGSQIVLPPELTHDVVSLDEPLPDAGQLREIVGRLHTAAEAAAGTGERIPLDDETRTRAVEAVQGLSAFAAEQVTAMSLSRRGLDIESLWERKRRQIERTPGLKVHRGRETFAEIGGVEVAKGFLGRVVHGRNRPNTVVFVDEIEKMLAGSGDTSGVSQDQLGQLLSYMQDHAAAGTIFIGPPGAAKSAVAKATGNEAGIPTIELDLGGAKGGIVGQSESRIRDALKVITAVSSDRTLWIATCNSIGNLPPELRRRFTLGTFFFDLPSPEERAAIWDIYIVRYWPDGRDAPAGCIPRDDGWTGAEIKQCCEIAWRLACTLDEAAAFVVPVARSAARQIEDLRQQADGRFLSASTPGVYRYPKTAAVRLRSAKFYVGKALSPAQRKQAADTFSSDDEYLTARKKLLNTRAPEYAAVTRVIREAIAYWKASTVPYPVEGIRLIRRDRIPSFEEHMRGYRTELEGRVVALDQAYRTLREEARGRLGELFSEADYPASLSPEFAIGWEFPNVEPPDHLKQLHPEVWEREQKRIAERFDEAVRLAEDAFAGELSKLVTHLLDRLSGGDDGTKKIFRDTAVTNLQEFFERFRELNVGSESGLEELVEQAERALGGVDPGELRKEAGLRDHVAKDLAEVAKVLDGLLVERPVRAFSFDDEPGDDGEVGR